MKNNPDILMEVINGNSKPKHAPQNTIDYKDQFDEKGFEETPYLESHLASKHLMFVNFTIHE